MLEQLKNKRDLLPMETRRHIREPIFRNMEDFWMPNVFNAAICTRHTFGLLACPEAREKAVRCVHLSLKNGGLFILDLISHACFDKLGSKGFSIDTVYGSYKREPWQEDSGRIIVLARKR